jgi:hypothetical protein
MRCWRRFAGADGSRGAACRSNTRNSSAGESNRDVKEQIIVIDSAEAERAIGLRRP